MFAAWKTFLQFTFLSVEEWPSLCHLFMQDIGFSRLFAIVFLYTVVYGWIYERVVKMVELLTLLFFLIWLISSHVDLTLGQ